jgi:hypothetical protein
MMAQKPTIAQSDSRRKTRDAAGRGRMSGKSASGAGVANMTQAIRVNIQRRRGSLHDLFRNHHFPDAFEARHIEHGVEQNALHDRAQAARAPVLRSNAVRAMGIAPPRQGSG